MLKRYILFPFLFILYVIGNLVITNLGQLDPLQALSPLLVLLCVTGLLIGLLQLFLRNWHYAGYFGFLLMALFLIYGHLGRLIASWTGGISVTGRLILLVIWWLFLMGIGWRKVWQRLGGERVTYALNIFFLCALLVQVISSVPDWIQAYSLFSGETGNELLTSNEPEPDLHCQNTPDIYYIIVDGHSRQDVLQELYGVDSTNFYSYLEAKGFFVAEQSYTNYTQTPYSLGASLNFAYLGLANAGTSELGYFYSVLSSNRIMHWLQDCGYQIYVTQSGFLYSKFYPVENGQARVEPLNDFASLILLGSPLDVFTRAFVETRPNDPYQSQRDLIKFGFDDLQSLSTTPGPKFVMTHIMAPHPPFVFGADGQPVQPDRDYTALDGNAFPGSIEEYRAGYADQVHYIDQMLMQTIDTILKDSVSPPVVIIQGDHGAGSSFNWNSVDQSCLWERSAILNAYYLPGVDNSQLYPGISPVNSFRVVLNAYFGTDFELLDDRSYYIYYQYLNERVDITDTRASRDNCSLP